jgi:hypothetical protein
MNLRTVRLKLVLPIMIARNSQEAFSILFQINGDEGDKS